jgi:hypothetical protein
VGPATIEYRVSTVQYYSKYRVRERIEYRFRVPSAAVFTLYSYSKTLEYRFRVPTAGSLRKLVGAILCATLVDA